MLRAKDFMTKDVITLKKETSIEKAAELLLKNKISGAPVVEDDMTLVGIITEKDILRLFYVGKDHKSKTVSDFMTRHPIHYHQEESLKRVCDFMMTSPFRRIPVTSKGKVIGIISRPDVIRYILQRSREGTDIG